MKKNKLVLITMLVLIVIALSFVLTDKNSTLFGNESNFAVRDTANIVKIYMADKNERSILFERTDDGWTLNGKNKAHKMNMEMLLSTLKRLEVKFPVSQKAHNNVITIMAGNSIKVEVYKNDHYINIGSFHLFPYVNKTKVFYVGNATQDNQGTVMLLEGAERPYVVTLPGFRGFVAARFTTNTKDWMSHEVFKIPYNRIAEVSVESPEHPSKSYQIRKMEKGYEIMSLVNRQILSVYDTVALYTFLDAFKNINYESLLDDMEETKIDSIIHSQPVFIIKVKETNGEEHEIKTFKMKGLHEQDLHGFESEYDYDRMYGWQNNQMLMIQYYSFDKITRPIEFFYLHQGRNE